MAKYIQHHFFTLISLFNSAILLWQMLKPSRSTHGPEAERALLSGIRLEPVSDAEQHLLDFIGQLIVDVARSHPRVRDLDVALWIARVAVGDKK